jgi:hypothetical protein
MLSTISTAFDIIYLDGLDVIMHFRAEESVHPGHRDDFSFIENIANALRPEF